MQPSLRTHSRNRNRTAALLGTFALSLASCALESRFLQPRKEWLAEPTAHGLAFEDVVLETGPKTTVHAWFIPSARSRGRTVLLCHGSAANISFFHPYHRLFHDAGWNVFAFDYRGFGKSAGELDLDALFTDTEAALDHLLERKDVDRDRIAIVGISLGAIVALRTMARRPEPFAYVVEDVASPRAATRASLGALAAWWVGTFVLPADIEPVENAERVTRPGLFLVGERDRALRDHLAAAATARGPTSLWVMPDTGHAPSGMLAHDGEYQRAWTRFLDGADAGAAPRISTRTVAWNDGELVIDVERHPASDGRSAVELCLLPPDGAPTFHRRWLESDVERWTVSSPVRPEFVAAFAYEHVAELDYGGWRAAPGPLASAATLLPLIAALAAGVAEDPESVPRARSFASTFVDFETAHGAWPAIAAAELVPSLLSAARALAAHGGSERALIATELLERCVAAAPANPALHYWPDEPYVAGFRYSADIEEARNLLATLRSGN